MSGKIHRASRTRRSAAGALAAALALAAVASAAKEDTATDLTQDGVQAAFQILRQDYIRGADLDFVTLNRVALDGLLDHLQAGAKIVPLVNGAERGKAEPQVLSVVMAEKIGWVRPLTFAAEEAGLLAAELERLRREGCTALLLDLRQPAPGAVFETAAAMLECFVPPGRTLFRLARPGREEAEIFISSREAVWEGPVIALVNAETNNAGEAVAAVLRQMRLALLVGEPTQGATVRYQTLPLDAEHALQYASAEMLLPDGVSLFQKGLQPDLKVAMSAAESKAAWEKMEQGRVRELVHETARPRFNEAALVARRNPELDSYLKRSQSGGDDEERLPPADAVLQRAVDLLQSSWRLDTFRLEWKQPAGEDGKETAPPETRKAIPVTGS